MLMIFKHILIDYSISVDSSYTLAIGINTTDGPDVDGLCKPEQTRPIAYSSCKPAAITKTSHYRTYVEGDKASRRFLVYQPQATRQVAINPIPCHLKKSGLTPTYPR